MKIPSIRKDVSQSNPTLQDIIEALEILTGRRGRNARIDYGIVAGQPTDPIYIYELTRVINGLSSNIYYANAYSSFAEAVNTIGSAVATLIVSSEQMVNASIDVNAIAPNTTVIVTGSGKFVGSSTTTLNLGKFEAPLRQVFSGLTVTFGEGAVDAVRPEWWGAKGDGTTDDTTALQRATVSACSSGKPLYLGDAHYITATIPITDDLVILGRPDGTVFSTSDQTIYFFTTSVDDLNIRIENINAVGELGILNVANDFGDVEVSGCDFEGVADVVTNLCLLFDEDITGTLMNVHHNSFQKCTPVYADNVIVDDLMFDDNTITDGVRHIVRALAQPDGSDPDAAGAKNPKRIYFRRNKVRGVNTALTDKSTVARVLQAHALEGIEFDSNDIYHLNTTTTGTVIYSAYGSLKITNNRIARVEGGAAGTGKHIISDKLGDDLEDRYTYVSYGNVFDQTDIVLSKTPDSVFHLYTKNNYSSENDTFIGCRCPVFNLYHSVDTGDTAHNISLKNAKVYDHKYPAVVAVTQQAKQITIEGFDVYKMSNPDSVSFIGQTRLRFVDLYQSFDNALGIEDVTIKGNTIYEADSDFALVHPYLHVNATTAFLKNIKVLNNTFYEGAYLARYQNGEDMGSFTFIGNIAPSTASYAYGTAPDDLTLIGNTVDPSGTLTWNPGSLADGAGETSSAITVTGAAFGDFVSVSAPYDLQGITTNAYVSAANAVKIRIQNETGGTIDLASGTWKVSVTKK